MATGFAAGDMAKGFRVVVMASAILAASVPAVAQTQTARPVTVQLVDAGKARVSLEGREAVELSVGQERNGIKLLALSKEGALLNIDGARRFVEIAAPVAQAMAVVPAPRASAPPAAAPEPARESRASVVLAADERGHFVTLGKINGSTVRFLVDTGATLVAFSSAEARRLGIDYKKGEMGYAQTAGGVVSSYQIKLDTVQVGEVTLYNVDAMVNEGASLPVALLGMSFLNRMEMRREGIHLTLTKRF